MRIATAEQSSFESATAMFAPSHSVVVDDMRAYLAGLKPMSASEQLRQLRVAFPDAPLGDRVAACAPRA